MTKGTWMNCPVCGARELVQIEERATEVHPPDVVVQMVFKIAASHTPKCEAAYAARKVSA